MHPALKLFCVLWLFMGAMASAVGFRNGVIEVALIGLMLTIFSVSGILGLRAAPMALMFFWLSMLLCYVVLFLTGRVVDLPRAIFPCLMFIGFAFVCFLCGEAPPAADDGAEQEGAPGDSSASEPD